MACTQLRIQYIPKPGGAVAYRNDGRDDRGGPKEPQCGRMRQKCVGGKRAAVFVMAERLKQDSVTPRLNDIERPRGCPIKDDAGEKRRDPVDTIQKWTRWPSAIR